MTNIRNQMHYKAVYQYGYVIFGVGRTENDAIGDAKQYADNTEDWWMDIDYSSKVDGKMILIDISEALYDKVLEFGGNIKIQKDEDEVYRLPEELEEDSE